MINWHCFYEALQVMGCVILGILFLFGFVRAICELLNRGHLKTALILGIGIFFSTMLFTFYQACLSQVCK